MQSALPIKALLVFDAVMKHHSLTLAARDLHVTPGAVGQQIQKLEIWVGVPLFIRSVRQLHPTTEALKYWASIKPALAQIQQASNQLRLSHVNEVWLSMPPTLAAKWFAPRMESFLAQCPGTSLHLSAGTGLVDFERDQIDLAIRYFDAKDCSLDVTLLYGDEARLYCSPEYAKNSALKTLKTWFEQRCCTPPCSRTGSHGFASSVISQIRRLQLYLVNTLINQYWRLRLLVMAKVSY